MRKRHLIFSLLFIASGISANEVRDGAAWRTAPPAAGELETLKQKITPLLDTSLQDLYASAQNEKQFISHSRPKMEWDAWRLAHYYQMTGDPEAAKACAALLAGLARREWTDPPPEIHIEGKWIPYPAAIAYDMVRESEIWPLHIEEGGATVTRRKIEEWLREYAVSFHSLLDRPGQITNYTPFGLRHAASLALVLKDPVLMQRCLEVATRLAFSPEFWHADHIWQEGTVSYARQVTGNLRALLPMLREGRSLGWIDPPGKEIENLSQRLEQIDGAQIRFSMPGGRPVPVHDTHWTIPSDSLPRAPANLALPDFGHYALAGKDMELHLSIPMLTGGGRYGGGHMHDSRLSIQLWAHGQEVLPDAGYPFQPANHRYFHMSPYAHNTAIALDQEARFGKGPYGIWEGEWAGSGLLGYDDGQASDGMVGYLAASSPGPVSDRVTQSVRQLIQVSTGEWSGYVVDAFWLQGGQSHRWFLRQTEDEFADQTIDVPLSDAGKTMADVLGDALEGDDAWTARLAGPKRIESDSSFHISWKGRESGVAVNIHAAPQPDSASWLSQMPRVRPTGQDPEKRDDFPGWHLFRERTVAPKDLTLWAAVYEPVARDETPKIKAVQWTRNDDGTAFLVEITLKDRTDTWALRLAGTDETRIGDVKLAGSAAGYSKRKGALQWTWAATGSRLQREGIDMISKMKQPDREVLSVSTTDKSTRLRVKGSIDLPSGSWTALRFQDGSGRGLRLGSTLSQSPEETEFLLESDPGFQVDDAGMKRTMFPLHSIEGPVHLLPLGGVFKNINEAAHFLEVYPTLSLFHKQRNQGGTVPRCAFTDTCIVYTESVEPGENTEDSCLPPRLFLRRYSHMNIPWIDAVILTAALVGAHTGRKRGLGRELWRILRRLFPAIFGLSLYTAMAAMLTKLPGVGSVASKFWGFVLIYGAVLILIHKGRSRFRDRFITWGNRKPEAWAAGAGAVRSLMGSALVVFVLSMFPVDAVREALLNTSWFARIFHRLF